ncbi:septum formation protein [Bathymodiolus japonicus methanotrophic gill symbiont]|uniref:Maf family protein n=1 Tax=Bathymodiolus japonicus methanotrophic gill symbiont TaxID=113269 RepID=UPI001B4E83CA|nr:nucleoside triphosphate pyrophosphatase [Bathymodiolus japonicus methanotrophic gill symbiont]GFO71294.1 septum formation protein [Bathymodiolus japonicus methanotrophic gill symbiont]
MNFTCATPAINEAAKKDETPSMQALRLAKEKSRALASDYPSHLIIAADQVAMSGQIQLTKPGNKHNAIKQLQLSSGSKVIFYTSICILDSATGKIISDLDICTVYFKKLSDQQIANYIALEQPYDCAGSFKSEGLGIALFERIEGDDPNALIGLPLIKLIALLAALDINVLEKI